jgi:hypothetical protein
LAVQTEDRHFQHRHTTLWQRLARIARGWPLMVIAVGAMLTLAWAGLILWTGFEAVAAILG